MRRLLIDTNIYSYALKGDGDVIITPAIEYVNFMRHKQPLDDRSNYEHVPVV